MQMHFLTRLLLLSAVIGLPHSHVLAQEGVKEFSVDEIVARHEASWAKLERLAIKAEVKKRTKRCAVGVNEDGTRVAVYDFHESKVAHEIHSDGLRQRDHEYEIGEDISTHAKWTTIRDKGLITRIFGNSAEVFLETAFGPNDGHYFGRTLERHGHAHTTLREWIAEAKPSMTRSTNEAGEAVYTLKGKFRSKYTYEGKPYDEVDLLTLVVNADRGCMIERFTFECEPTSRIKQSQWTVKDWTRVGEGVYFPSDFRTDLVNREGETYWLEYLITSVTLDPPELEKQFEVSFNEGMRIADHTQRPGAFPHVILGANGKPTMTFLTDQMYFAFVETERQNEHAKWLEELVTPLYPTCKISCRYDAGSKEYLTSVYDQGGALVRDFRSEREIELCFFVQDLVAFALGSGTLRR